MAVMLPLDVPFCVRFARKRRHADLGRLLPIFISSKRWNPLCRPFLMAGQPFAVYHKMAESATISLPFS